MTRTRPRLVAAALVAATLLLGAAACSDDDEPDATSGGTTESADETAADDAGNPYGSTEATDPAEEETTASSEAAAEGVSIATADTDLGTILVDAEGNTLYMFSSDTQGEPTTCTGGCAGAWPALNGTVTAGDGVDESLIGTAGEQATYNGWPLYYYAQDTAPGDTNGQGVGGVWWVVDAEGNPVES